LFISDKILELASLKRCKIKSLSLFFTIKHGIGLGLATVFGIVSPNHGDIVVHSEEGVGNEFLV
jgi:signal transduction histidine kinase